MKKIAIISDTHDVLRDEVIKELNTCDLIFHAGDFVKEEIYQQLQKIAPIIAVKGNNDKFDLPEELNCEIAFNASKEGCSKCRFLYFWTFSPLFRTKDR